MVAKHAARTVRRGPDLQAPRLASATAASPICGKELARTVRDSRYLLPAVVAPVGFYLLFAPPARATSPVGSPPPASPIGAAPNEGNS
jgi:hypothetical protein